jgi:type II secretory pathway component GspD/PulD (secretin)
LLVVALSQPVFAQTVTIMQDGKPVQMSVEQMKAMRKGGPPGAPPGAQPAPQPGQEPKPEDKDKKKEGEEAKKKEDSTIKRPEKPPRVPDPREFNVKLDDKGRVPPFNFIGQPWPDVMQWLASLSKSTLDWQELPNDYLNLTTDRPYPLDEVRDRINRALQARGFTSIRADDVLSVFKIDKIDPSLVRRVEEDKLYDMKPYDFVKVSFELPANMEVDKAKEDVKQVLSPTAKVFPLVTSKRLLIMDTVANLRTVSELFNSERMVQDGRIVPKEYFLKYARPQQVIEILYMMVGVDPKAKPTQTDPQAQAQQMQMMQQMQQQGRGAEAAKMMQKGGDQPKVYLAYNRQRNSVLVNAPPEQLKIIEQTIRCLDVPYGDGGAMPAAATATSDSNQRTMKRYPLQNLDPDKFVSTLEEIGGLSPYAVFKVDDNNKTLFALAPEADHKKIAALLSDFDGSGRHFKVIPLRRLPADAVAATIYKLMAGQNDKKDENKRRPYWYYDFDSNNSDKKKDTIQGFGVDADIENNRLLVWANDSELQRVQELLAQLGEVPAGQQDTRPVRMIEPSDPKATPELLKQLKEAWSASGGGELIINTPTVVKPAPKTKEKDDKDKEKPKTDKSATSGSDRSARSAGPTRIPARFAQLGPPASPPAKQDASKPAIDATTSPAAPTAANPAQPSTTTSSTSAASAPVTITVTPDGRIMLSSSDTAALDRMEELIEKLSPPQRRFKVYQLQNMRAFDMWLTLTNYFKEDMDKKEKNNDFSDWWFGYRPRSDDNKGGATGLAKRHKLLIDYDPPSNTILVANASASQTAEVEQLIKEYDKPARSDSVEKRATMPIKIQYSRPTIIAAAVKEVYRDLLSSKDKEFDKGDQKGDKRPSAERVTIIDYPGSSSGDGESRPSQIKVGFDGALSLGADDVSGILIVSAQKGIFDDIVKMVHELDEQAAPKTTVQVHRLYGTVSAEALQKALDKAVGKAWIGNRPEQQPNQTGAPEAEKKPGNERRGNRSERNQESERK